MTNLIVNDSIVGFDIERFDSTDSNVSKYVFTKGDAVAESVLYKYPTYAERTVICCSTQSGCPVGCRFCGTGERFVRSLTADEIVAQPQYLLDQTGVDPNSMDRLQIMFMSMGEPLLNQKHLFEAIRRLHKMYPKAALLISTSGPNVNYSELRQLSVEVPTVGLQFSVHESTNEARDALIPFERKLTLEQIALEGELWYNETGRNPFFNYCVHEDNDSDNDVARLVKLFNPSIWQATLSVICERDESMAVAHERQQAMTQAFSSKMLEQGYSTRVFNPAGQDDIGGGCGQLWFVQQWMDEHPDKAKRSAGHGKDIVHADY